MHPSVPLAPVKKTYLQMMFFFSQLQGRAGLTFTLNCSLFLPVLKVSKEISCFEILLSLFFST